MKSPVRAILFHSPGRKPWVLIIETYLLSPKGAALPRRKANACVVVPLLRSSYFCVHVYPGFHIGLCPHSTLGYEEVSCLKALAISLNFDEVTLSCDGGQHIPPLSAMHSRTSARTYRSEYIVLVVVSTRKHFSKYAYLFQ